MFLACKFYIFTCGTLNRKIRELLFIISHCAIGKSDPESLKHGAKKTLLTPEAQHIDKPPLDHCMHTAQCSELSPETHCAVILSPETECAALNLTPVTQCEAVFLPPETQCEAAIPSNTVCSTEPYPGNTVCSGDPFPCKRVCNHRVETPPAAVIPLP